MKVYYSDQEIPKKSRVATIGFFDGVHLGHRYLIDQVKDVAQRLNFISTVISFDVHPLVVVRSDFEPQLLNDVSEKVDRLSSTGIDETILLRFNQEMVGLTAKEFLQDILFHKMGIKTLIVGYDHRFGKDRACGFNDYVRFGEECGMEVIQAKSLQVGAVPISSSLIRKALADGELDNVNNLLGTPYTLTGIVVKGFQVGSSKLGYPTANIEPLDEHKIIPKSGVYAAELSFDGKTYKGMLYIGSRPTLERENDYSIEINLFDFNQDIYNKRVTLTFLKYFREDMKFDNLDALRVQLSLDHKNVSDYFGI